MNPRRHFIRCLTAGGAAILMGSEACADLPLLDEKDPTAAALGYVTDATRANKAKYPTYAPGQACGACQLYQGKAGDATGPCPLYAGKSVMAKGWCSAFVKKA